MSKKIRSALIVACTVGSVSAETHSLRTVSEQNKVVAADVFKASVKVLLNNSVGMLSTRVAKRTALCSDQKEKKCAKK